MGLCRGKRVDNNEWVYGFYFCIHHNDDRKHLHHFIIPLNVPIPKDKPIGEIQVEVDTSTIGQYTGLTANGKKIFDGDIVRFSTPYCLYTAPIVYQNGVWCADNKREASFTLYSIMKLTPEVIGNIHDNPELLLI